MARDTSKRRDVSGILLLDKPTGISSNKALQTAARLFNARKSGHTGSLDPLASGMLPLCFGEATKVSGFLHEADKSYAVTARFGVVTDTGDSDGDVVECRDGARPDDAELRAALDGFRGEIDQVPPMYSALKHKGQPLYKLARAGKEVERKSRRVNIRELELVAHEADECQLTVVCSKGTYIRSLVVDLGEKLGCGAHVTQLRRLWVNPFQGQPMVTLEQLEAQQNVATGACDGLLLGVDSALDFPQLELGHEQAAKLRSGQLVFGPEHLRVDDHVLLYAPGRVFLGIGIGKPGGFVAPKRLIRADACT